MKFLHEYLTFFPDWLVPSVVALMTIIIGYILSKILAAGVSSLFQKHDKDVAEGEQNFGSKLARFIFWTLWAGFIVLAVYQYPLINSTFTRWQTNNSFHQIGIISLITVFVVFLKELVNRKRLHLIKPTNLKLPQMSFFTQRMLYNFGTWFFIILSGLALGSPTTIWLKILATLFLILMGGFLGKIIKQVLTSGFELVSVDKNISDKAPQFLMYFVLSTFLLTALEVWI